MHTNITIPEGDRLVDRKERRRIIPYSDMHYGRLEKRGLVPARIKLSPNGRVAWRLSELLAYVQQKTAERDAKASEAIGTE